MGVCDEFSDKNFDDYYELKRKCIGRGELCEIRHCWDKRTGGTKTVKVFRKTDLNEKTKELIIKEMKILALLDHSNIAKVHEAFEDQFKIYMVLDDLFGESLFNRIIK